MSWAWYNVIHHNIILHIVRCHFTTFYSISLLYDMIYISLSVIICIILYVTICQRYHCMYMMYIIRMYIYIYGRYMVSYVHIILYNMMTLQILPSPGLCCWDAAANMYTSLARDDQLLFALNLWTSPAKKKNKHRTCHIFS